MLTCRPTKAAQSFTPAKEANDAMRAILAEVEPRFPGVRFGLTGLPVLETDEMVLSEADSTRASWLALLGVAVLYFVVYRGCRYPLLTVTTLVVGTLWALGWATLTVGHLNILSATFAVMLIGLGDYGVLWVARYDEARRCGEIGRGRAPAHGACTLGRASSPRPRRPGWRSSRSCSPTSRRWPNSAGSPAAGCCSAPRVASLLMPALLVLADERRRSGGCNRPIVWTSPGSTRRFPFPTPWLPGLARRPRLALAVGAVLLVVCGAFALRLTYDHNLLNLQARELDSVRWEHKLIDRAAGATWDALSIAHTREEALALKAKYEALPEVGRSWRSRRSCRPTRSASCRSFARSTPSSSRSRRRRTCRLHRARRPLMVSKLAAACRDARGE